MNVLVLNCGSSTIKYELFQEVRSIASGTVELVSGYREAVRSIVAALPARPGAVAHRVVHGGEPFTEPVLLTEAILAKLRELSYLAPLHNPPAIEGIEAARDLGVPMAAVFDTAFHATLPETASRYAIPSRPGVRRYGFHGTSHRYIAEEYARLAGSPEPTIVTLHLGNGCSACAIRRGRSVETSMGFTPLEGLVMGTRAGDVDPALVLLLAREHGIDEAERILNRESGLLALAGTNDMRAILSRVDEDARRAVEIFCHRVRKYVGAYLAVLEGAEAIVFTGGIGENSAEIRRRVCAGFAWAGLKLDDSRTEGRISTEDSRLHAWVIRTDEEKLIAREAIRLLKGGRDGQDRRRQDAPGSHRSDVG